MVKICPNCSRANNESRLTCKVCRVSLQNIQPTGEKGTSLFKWVIMLGASFFGVVLARILIEGLFALWNP